MSNDIFFNACHFRSISSAVAFNIMSSLEFLDSGNDSAVSNKAAWSSGRSFASNFL